MKTWERPDFIKLDVTETASGGNNRDDVDGDWDGELNGKPAHITTWNPFKTSGNIQL